MPSEVSSRARMAHRRIALFLGAFVVIHFVTHLSALGGIDGHARVLDAARQVYRAPPVEAALLTAFVVQIGLGLTLVRRRVRAGAIGFWGKVQLISGLFLVFFIVAHSSAALGARWLNGIDTNFYWPAGTLVLEPLKWGFAPYYVLAILAFCSHLGAALHFRGHPMVANGTFPIGLLLAIAILPAFGGFWYTIEMPPEYIAYYQSIFGDNLR